MSSPGLLEMQPWSQFVNEVLQISLPQMTTTERDNLVQVTNGRVIYNTTSATLQVYQGGAWVNLTTLPLIVISGASGWLTLSGTHAERFGINFSQLTLQPPSGANAAAFISAVTIDEAASGTHPLLTNLYIGAPTITPGDAAVTNAATVYIDGETNAAVTGNNYALWVNNNGLVRLGTNVRFGAHTGSADAAISGYVTITDDAGNTRKLAVIP